MTLFREKYRIESARLKEWDYSSEGWYYITICTKNREEIFGKIINDEMVLNDFGEIILEIWGSLPQHYDNIILDEFVVMPNHIHAIIGINNVVAVAVTVTVTVETGLKPVSTTVDTNTGSGTGGTTRKKHGISEFIRALKTFSARQINEIRNTKGTPVWQPRFYDRIIRNEEELNRIRQYIKNNPKNWKHDRNAVMDLGNDGVTSKNKEGRC